MEKENKRMYLQAWEFNAARILTELSKIVTTYGGRVKPSTNVIVSDRTAESLIRKYSDEIRNYTKLEKETCCNDKPLVDAAIKELREKFDTLKSVEHGPVTVAYTTNIQYVYNGFLYSYFLWENPFCDFGYKKTPVENGEYSIDARAIWDKKEWLRDCFLSSYCTKKDIEIAATSLFFMMLYSEPSRIEKRVKRIVVPNTYDGGYHYEIVPEKRMEKVEF